VQAVLSLAGSIAACGVVMEAAAVMMVVVLVQASHVKEWWALLP
jgi:hypothetical protein